MPRRLSFFAVCALVAVAGAGCTRARARTAADVPALAVPAPPPREVAASDPPPIEPTGAPFPTAGPTPPAPPVPPSPAPRPPARTPQAEPETRAEAPEPAPPRVLRPADAAEVGRVRELLTRTARDLGRINYGRLSAGGRGQYDQAKRFADQAEDAIRDGNLPFAHTLADKAATLAAALVGR